MSSYSFTEPVQRATAVDPSVVQPAPVLPAAQQKKLKDTATQLEATFTGYLMEEFNKGLPGSEGGFASQVYADMFKQSIATKVAQSGSGKGLADQIYKNAEQKALKHGDGVSAAAQAAQAAALTGGSFTLRSLAATTPNPL